MKQSGYCSCTIPFLANTCIEKPCGKCVLQSLLIYCQWQISAGCIPVSMASIIKKHFKLIISFYYFWWFLPFHIEKSFRTQIFPFPVNKFGKALRKSYIAFHHWFAVNSSYPIHIVWNHESLKYVEYLYAARYSFINKIINETKIFTI